MYTIDDFEIGNILMLEEDTTHLKKGTELYLSSRATVECVHPYTCSLSPKELYGHLKGSSFKRVGANKSDYGDMSPQEIRGNVGGVDFRIDKLTSVTTRIFVSNYLITYNNETNKLRVFDENNPLGKDIPIFNTEKTNPS